MKIFKKAIDGIAPRTDMNLIVRYIEAYLKNELNRARVLQKDGIVVSMNDLMLHRSRDLIEELIPAIPEMERALDYDKRKMRESLKRPLTPDEEYTIGIGIIKDIKKSKLTRKLEPKERALLRSASPRFDQVFAKERDAERNRARFIRMPSRQYA